MRGARGLLVALAASQGALALRLGSPTMVAAGQPAPAFSCKSHTGETVSLSDFAGKRVMLWFYPRAGTGG